LLYILFNNNCSRYIILFTTNWVHIQNDWCCILCLVNRLYSIALLPIYGTVHIYIYIYIYIFVFLVKLNSSFTKHTILMYIIQHTMHFNWIWKRYILYDISYHYVQDSTQHILLLDIFGIFLLCLFSFFSVSYNNYIYNTV
jgi:hypothetical protein